VFTLAEEYFSDLHLFGVVPMRDIMNCLMWHNRCHFALIKTRASIEVPRSLSLNQIPFKLLIIFVYLLSFFGLAVSAANATSGKQIAAGGYHSCAIVDDGAIMCWGYNFYGQLGRGSSGDIRLKPARVIGIEDATHLSLGLYHSCARLRSGGVQCWGKNQNGQLGNGTTTDSASPVEVSGINNATSVAVGWRHSCARLSNGRVQCWGTNSVGEVSGNPSGPVQYSVPKTVVEGASEVIMENATSITAETGSSCATFVNSGIRCWGINSEPRDVLGDAGILLNATQTSGTCTTISGGTVRCWGYNEVGQLGNGTTDNLPWRRNSVLVSGIESAAQVAAGRSTACARLTDGTLRCWGYNEFGQLGNGNNISQATPVRVRGISNAQSISVGLSHSCAVLADETVRCWGYNKYGQLGNGNKIDRATPVKVVGIGVAIPRNVKWIRPSAAKQPVKASFSATKDVSYRIELSRVSGKKPFSRQRACSVKRKKVLCSARVPTRGKWRATITPNKGAIQGEPVSKRFRVSS